MSRPVLLCYALRLQEAFRQTQQENEFLSWEFGELKDNLAFFAGAAKLAHQLNAADIETIAGVATDELPGYFGCRSAALFFRHPVDNCFELYRATSPLPAKSLPPDTDRFLRRLFGNQPQPFLVRHHPFGCIAMGDNAAGRNLEAVSEDWLRAFGETALVFPLWINEREGKGEDRRPFLLGGLVIGDSLNPLETRDEDMAAIFRDLLSSSLHNARLVRKLNELTVIDPLTRVHNRRHLFDQLEKAVAQALRREQPLALVMLDIDGFKQFNDAHGHLCGDEVLRRIGALLKEQTRRGIDTAARYGGEEFVLLLPFTGREAALEVAERLRRRIRESGVEFEGRTLSVTASLGVTVFVPGETEEMFVDRADAALYRAKSGGRDRVCDL